MISFSMKVLSCFILEHGYVTTEDLKQLGYPYACQVFTKTHSSEKTAEQEPDDRHKQCGEQVERATVFQLKQGETTARNQQTANNQQFCHEGIADS